MNLLVDEFGQIQSSLFRIALPRQQRNQSTEEIETADRDFFKIRMLTLEQTCTLPRQIDPVPHHGRGQLFKGLAAGTRGPQTEPAPTDQSVCHDPMNAEHRDLFIEKMCMTTILSYYLPILGVLLI